jgi:hypothetical protein
MLRSVVRSSLRLLHSNDQFGEILWQQNSASVKPHARDFAGNPMLVFASMSGALHSCVTVAGISDGHARTARSTTPIDNSLHMLAPGYWIKGKNRSYSQAAEEELFER